ncbi:unnamed protein product [Sphagnum balticum]
MASFSCVIGPVAHTSNFCLDFRSSRRISISSNVALQRNRTFFSGGRILKLQPPHQSRRSLKMATSQIEKNVDLRGEQDSEGVGAAASTSLVQPQKGAAEIVQEFYAAFNRREIDTIGNLFAEDCVYEDLVFPKPFSGRQAILEFFQKFMDSVGPELEFRIDDISSGDPSATGVVWHLEWRGRQFPFSKGCSFYRCDIIEGQRQIIYGRDAVEPATKPGDFTLIALKGVAALLRQFPSLADRF